MTRAVEQRLVFGQVAEMYQRVRPEYPGALLETLGADVELADAPRETMVAMRAGSMK